MTRAPDTRVDAGALERGLARALAGTRVALEAVDQAHCGPRPSRAAAATPVATATVAVPGLACGGDGALVAYPADVGRGATYPLVVLAHGVLYSDADADAADGGHCAGGVLECYGALLRGVARGGFVAVVPDTDATGWCAAAADDQRAVLDRVGKG